MASLLKGPLSAVVEETLAPLEGLSVILLHAHHILEVIQLNFKTRASQLLFTVQGDRQCAYRYMRGLEVKEFRAD